MLRLAMMMYAIVGTSLAGAAVVAALVAGYDTWQGLLLAAVIGAVAAVPASWSVARQIGG